MIVYCPTQQGKPSTSRKLIKVLFVSSGRQGKVNPIVRNQGESLAREGILVDYFMIDGNGFWGYIKSIPQIRKTFKRGNYHITHAHYSFSAFAASLAGCFPIVVSLMGSDAYMSRLWKLIASIFYYLMWEATIVKSEGMKSYLKFRKAVIVPNGVNLERFIPTPINTAKEKVGFPKNKIIIGFIADPDRQEKNFKLAEESVTMLRRDDIELRPVYGVDNVAIHQYLNAANVILLTSKWEGSPNIIKEAMACNRPIVSTNVGDVKSIINGVSGCFIAKNSAEDVGEKLLHAITYSQTTGRKRIVELGLDSVQIANRIITLYKRILNINQNG